VNITRKTRRTRVPKAAKELVLRRDKSFEKRINLLSVRIQREMEEERSQKAAPLSTNKFLQTVVR
jgi:hypothetical protein